MYSARKTRSLSICLIMVLSAMGPVATLATADHDSIVGMNSSMIIDGDEYEMVEVPFWGDIISCNDEGDYYTCDVDLDGDGNYDGNWHFNDCEMDAAGEWECVYSEQSPLLDEGNYSIEFQVWVEDAEAEVGVDPRRLTLMDAAADWLDRERAALDRERQLLALEQLRSADRNLPTRATVAALVVATGLARTQ